MLKFFVLLFFLVVSLQAENRKITLVLPWKHQFQFAGYYVAKEMGYYAEAGLDVEIKEYDLKRDNTKIVAHNKYEFGVGHSSLILDKLNRYPNIILLNAIFQSSPTVLLALKNSNINTISDIAGKTIMMSKDQAYTASINAMLYSEGLAQNSFNIIDTSFTPNDLIQGNSDLMFSYTSNEPYFLEQKGVEYTQFNPKDYGYNFYSDILFTSKIMIEKEPMLVDSFVKASLKGWLYAFEHIDNSIEIILQHYNTQNKTKDALMYEAEVLKKLAFIDGVEFGNINPIRLNEVTTTYRLLGLLHHTKKIDFDSFIYKITLNSKSAPDNLDTTDSFNYAFIFTPYFKLFILSIILIVSLSLYFKHRVDILLKKKTEELNLKNKIFDQNICSSRTDINGIITYVSTAYCNLSGFSKDEFIGNTHSFLRDKYTSHKSYKELWVTISSGHTWRGEFKNIKKDTTPFWVNIIISPVIDKWGNISSFESIVQDISLKKVLEGFNEKLTNEVDKQTKKLKKISITDKLTGAYNRVKLDEVMESNYKYYQEFNENFALIILDIDHFKLVNDEHGHLIGDEILKGVVECIQESIRSTDILGRWGGEEFIIICPNSDEKTALTLTQNIRIKIQNCHFPRVKQITISGGVADMYANKDIDSIINSADEALYRAKKSGRNRIKGREVA